VLSSGVALLPARGATWVTPAPAQQAQQQQTQQPHAWAGVCGAGMGARRDGDRGRGWMGGSGRWVCGLAVSFWWRAVLVPWEGKDFEMIVSPPPPASKLQGCICSKDRRVLLVVPNHISQGIPQVHSSRGGKGPFSCPQSLAGTAWLGDSCRTSQPCWPCPALLHHMEPWKRSAEQLL